MKLRDASVNCLVSFREITNYGSFGTKCCLRLGESSSLVLVSWNERVPKG